MRWIAGSRFPGMVGLTPATALKTSRIGFSSSLTATSKKSVDSAGWTTISSALATTRQPNDPSPNWGTLKTSSWSRVVSTEWTMLWKIRVRLPRKTLSPTALQSPSSTLSSCTRTTWQSSQWFPSRSSTRIIRVRSWFCGRFRWTTRGKNWSFSVPRRKFFLPPWRARIRKRGSTICIREILRRQWKSALMRNRGRRLLASMRIRNSSRDWRQKQPRSLRWVISVSRRSAWSIWV